MENLIFSLNATVPVFLLMVLGYLFRRWGLFGEDLAEKMKWMMAHETERKVMGLKAYKAAARYKKELVMAEWEQAYLSVIS